MLVNGQLKTTTVIENTEKQLEKVSEAVFECRDNLKTILNLAFKQ